MHPLPERAMWLWEKIAWSLRRTPHQDGFVDVIADLAGVDVVDREQAAVLDVVVEEATEAIALLDGGLLPRVLRSVGALLPADERLLAEEWAAERHRLWTVASTRPGRSLGLVDVRTGEEVEALNGAVSRCTEEGEIVYAAVVPTGDGWFMPRHHLGIAPPAVPLVARWIEDCADPLDVAVRLFGTIRQEQRDDPHDGCDPLEPGDGPHDR